MKNKKKLEKIAEQIMNYERSMQSLDKCNSEILDEIENIASTLALEDMLFIDEYIQKNFS